MRCWTRCFGSVIGFSLRVSPASPASVSLSRFELWCIERDGAGGGGFALPEVAAAPLPHHGGDGQDDEKSDDAEGDGAEHGGVNPDRCATSAIWNVVDMGGP